MMTANAMSFGTSDLPRCLPHDIMDRNHPTQIIWRNFHEKQAPVRDVAGLAPDEAEIDPGHSPAGDDEREAVVEFSDRSDGIKYAIPECPIRLSAKWRSAADKKGFRQNHGTGIQRPEPTLPEFGAHDRLEAEKAVFDPGRTQGTSIVGRLDDAWRRQITFEQSVRGIVCLASSDICQRRIGIASRAYSQPVRMGLPVPHEIETELKGLRWVFHRKHLHASANAGNPGPFHKLGRQT